MMYYICRCDVSKQSVVAVQLYTQEFYQDILKPRLNPGGIFVTQSGPAGVLTSREVRLNTLLSTLRCRADAVHRHWECVLPSHYESHFLCDVSLLYHAQKRMEDQVKPSIAASSKPTSGRCPQLLTPASQKLPRTNEVHKASAA